MSGCAFIERDGIEVGLLGLRIVASPLQHPSLPTRFSCQLDQIPKPGALRRHFALVCRVPELHFAVLRTRGEGPAIGREGQRAKGALGLAQRRSLLPADRVPEGDRTLAVT